MPTSYPRLVVRDASGGQRDVDITRTPFRIGRLGDNDLVVWGDNRVSRHHARILQNDQGYVLEDTESRYGIFVNGEKVSSCLLKPGDQIHLGVANTCTICFEAEPSELPNLLEKLEEVGASAAPKLHHLNVLLEMAQALHRAPALEQVMTTLLDSAIQLADAERAMLFLRDDSGELRLRLARGRGGAFLSTKLADYFHEAVERVVQSGREEIVLEECKKGRAPQETGIISGEMRGVVAVPLQKLSMVDVRSDTIHGTTPELLGVLYLDSNARGRALTSLDRQVLRSLAVEGATVIENARLFRLSREQERIRQELALARNIQLRLLPRSLPEGGYFQVHAVTTPCETVGGDYYDVIRLPDDRYGFAVADVSGKGWPAAMLAASLQGAFAGVATGDPDLGDLFYQVNDFMCERTAPEMYATIFYGVLEKSGRVRFVNAGHTTPLVVRAEGIVEVLESSNYPLGFFAGASFTVDDLQLRPGDLLLVFSDGVTEARDINNELFGESRLKEFLKDCTNRAPQEVSAKVMDELTRYSGNEPQSDDLTLTILRFGPRQV